MAQMTTQKAHLIALWLKGILYGINTFLAWTCLFILACKTGRSSFHKFLIGIVVLQYLVSTVDVSLGLERILVAFINHSNQPGGPASYLSDETDPLNIANLLSISTNSILYDTVIVWRCYHVWRRDWKVTIVPAMLVIGTLACAIGQGISYHTLKDKYDVFSPHIMAWNTSLYALSLSTSAICTLLISFRVWSLLQWSRTKDGYYRLLILIIESGMLYSACLFIGLGLYATHSVSFYIVYGQLGQLSSIVPTMILLLVGMKLTSDDVQETMAMEKYSTFPPIVNTSPSALSAITPNRAETMAVRRMDSTTFLNSNRGFETQTQSNHDDRYYV